MSNPELTVDILNHEYSNQLFTEPQKSALLGAWRIIKRNLKYHARNVFTIFFEKYPNYLKDFDRNNENKFLHDHTVYAFQTIGSLIENDLNDPILFHCNLAKIGKIHHNVNINQADVYKFMLIVIDYLIKELSRHDTKTLEEALNIFFQKLVLYHSE